MTRRPHPMDPLIEDFTPLAESFGRSTADRGGEHHEAHDTAREFARYAAIQWSRAVNKPSMAFTIKAGSSALLSAAALVAMIAVTGSFPALGGTIASAVIVLSLVALAWHWFGRPLIARSEAGRRMMAFTKLEPRVLAAYTARRSELGLPGCDCP